MRARSRVIASCRRPRTTVGQGSRRAQAARRPDPRARVHHEGRLLVRPPLSRPRGELPQALGRVQRIFERCGIEAIKVAADPVPWAAAIAQDFLAPAGRARTRRHLRERRLCRRPRDRVAVPPEQFFPRSSRRRRRSRRSACGRSRRSPSSRVDPRGNVKAMLVVAATSSCSHSSVGRPAERDEAVAGRREVPAGRRTEIREAFGASGGLSGRSGRRSR